MDGQPFSPVFVMWNYMNEIFFFFFCLQGGIHGKISLTAYVVAALLETGISTDVSTRLMGIGRFVDYVAN